MEAWWNEYADYGFIVIEAHSEDNGGSTPDQSDLQDWVSYFNLTHPILSDPGGATDLVYDPYTISRPTYVLLAPGMEIVSIGGSMSAVSIEVQLPTSYP